MTGHQSSPRRSGQYDGSRLERDAHEDPRRFNDRSESFPLAAWNSDGSGDGHGMPDDDDENSWFSQEEEQRVVKKLDRRLVLFVALLYLLSFLDRSNIGNAKAAGLVTDLHLTEAQFHWILDGFYVTYILFEFMTICYRIFPAHIYISCCITVMGLVAALQSVTTGFWSMIILRLCLGIAEASFGPGIPFYLSFFFKRDELARRTGVFIAAAPLANSFAGSLAWLILRFAGGTIDGWRLLFIVEGFPNILLAVVAWYVIPDSPSSAQWLSGREQKVATLRLEKRAPKTKLEDNSRETVHQSLKWSKILDTLKDPKSYMVAMILFSLNVAFSSLPVFLPTIVGNMGFSALAAQGMSAFPNLSAFVIVLVTAILSDRYKSRSIPLIGHALMAMSGYALLAAAPTMPNFIRYLCLFPMTAGFFSAVTMVIVWTVNNHESDEGKAVGSSILQVFGHIGSLVGQQLYPDAGAPYYVKSHAICAFFMGLAALSALALRMVLKSTNLKRATQKPEYDYVGEDNETFMGGPNRHDFVSNFQYIL